ncbi:uncharacterized protein LOC120074653 isoform X2 [Benincasa hispida]|uniref:uncharacterized protein LOC120074653 isoform X2 n=1 Tax=Benincasa hispida TaxID=102211 RepID=UPI00190122BE|nr:uncharacterized protein LOC120074653 isoform X2 [Benincasa hispida]
MGKMSFDVDSKSKHGILMSASRKFQTFKTTLTQKFILLFKNKPSVLQFLPQQYSHIEQDQWISFVNERLSEEWDEISCLQKERRSKCVYNHHISRKGYVNLSQELNISSDHSYRATL